MTGNLNDINLGVGRERKNTLDAFKSENLEENFQKQKENKQPKHTITTHEHDANNKICYPFIRLKSLKSDKKDKKDKEDMDNKNNKKNKKVVRSVTAICNLLVSVSNIVQVPLPFQIKLHEKEGFIIEAHFDYTDGKK